MEPSTQTYNDPQVAEQAKNMTKAIFQTESGGNFNAKGKSGEHGAAQWMPETWKAHAKDVLGDENAAMTPENQSVVAQGTIRKLIGQGKNAAQIAAIWNSGSDENWEHKVGKNSKGVEYNVPKYVKSVTDAYQTIKSGGQANADPNNPSSVASPVASAPEEKHSILGKILDFAFPVLGDAKNVIQGDNKKSKLQILGDLGLSALWFAPGVGEAAGGAIKGAGLLGEAGSQIAGHAVGGAAMGYGGDVASKLAGGERDIKGLVKPGAGTVTGGLLGGALGKLGSKYSESNILKEVADSNTSILGQTKRGANDLAESFARGKNPGELLASKGINIAEHVNPETVAYETAHKAGDLRKDASTVNSVLTEALGKTPGNAPVSKIEKIVMDHIDEISSDKVTAAERKALIAKEFEAIRAHYGPTITLADANELKHRMWDLSKFDMAVPNATRSTYRVMGNTLKTAIEDGAKKAGLEGIKEMNDYVGSHLDAADALERLHGTKAKGGRLGDLMQKHTLGAIGGISGFFGGGPIGSLMGALAGEWAGGKLSTILRKVGSSPVKSAILRRMVQEDPAIVQKMLEYAKKTPQGLEALQEQLGNMGIPMFPDKFAGVKNAAPVLSPKVKQQGLVPRVIETTGIRTATTQNRTRE